MHLFLQRILKLFTLAYILAFSLQGANANTQDFIYEFYGNPTPNLYQMQKSFYKYWANKDSLKKSVGWKQFKRYEDFWTPRVFPSGFLPRPDILQLAKEQSEIFNKKINTTQAQNTWKMWGPLESPGGYSGLGRINFVYPMPNDSNTIWVGTASGGLWKTTNGGTTWTTNTDNLDVMPTLGVNDMAFDINNPNTMYIATGDHTGTTYSVGLLKSTDKGVTWETTGLNYNLNATRVIYNISLHPTNNKILYAATNSGIVKTTDGGTTWAVVRNGFARAVKVNVTDPNIVYAIDGSRFYRSNDGGTTWLNSSSGLPTGINRIAMEVAPSNSNTIYILASKNDNTFGGFYKSVDGGANWTTQSTTPNILGYEKDGSGTGGQGWYDLCLAVNPTNPDNVVIGGINLWQTFNGGTSWINRSFWYRNPPTPEVHADQHFVKFYNNTTLFVGNDGGVYRSRNNTVSWTYIGSGIQNTQLYKIGASDVSTNYVIGGAQDNGTKLFAEGDWYDVIGGDGMECLVKDGDPGMIYGSLYYGAITRTKDGDGNFVRINDKNADNKYDDINEEGGWVTPYLTDPNNPSHLYIGMKNIWKSTDDGDTFVKLTNGWSATLTILEIAPSNSAYMIASNGYDFKYSTDGGTTWATKSRPGSQYISSYRFHPTNPNIIYATCSGYSANEKVFMSQDLGTTWTNITYNLLNTPINHSTYFVGNNQNKLFIGTDLGVYSLNEGSNNWQAFNNGFPQVIVRELEIQKSDTLLVAGTYGRGIWYYDLKSSLTLQKPTLIFPANNSVNIALKNIPFRWKSVSDAGSYQVQISAKNDFSTVESDYLAPDTLSERTVQKNFEVYYWRVRAKNGAVYSDWSDIFTFRSMIATPTLTKPTNNQQFVLLSDSIISTIPPNTYKLHFQVSENQNFTTTLLNDSLVDNFRLIYNINLENNKTYYTKVRAVSMDGAGLWSETVKFSTIFKKPTLIFPPDQSIKNDTSITFLWDKVDGSAAYKFTLYKDNGVQISPIFSQTINSPNTTSILYQLSYEQEYYWNVQAINNTNLTVSDTFSFETKISPPTLFYPRGNKEVTNGKIDFIIEDLKFANNKKFQIEIYSNINSNRNLIYSTESDALITPIDLSDKLQTLLGSDTKICLDWRARAIKIQTQDTSAWTNYETFCYLEPSIILASPADNSQDVTTPIFSFKADSSISKFLLVLYKDNIDEKNKTIVEVTKSNLIDSTYIIKNVSGSSEPCSAYFWKVLGIVGQDTISSELRNYSTINSVVNVISPLQNIVFEKNNFTFTWDAKTNYTQYEILISTDNFQTILKQETLNSTTYTLKTPTDLLDKVIYWKVRAVKTEQGVTFACDWSQIPSLQFNTLYSAPILLQPKQSEVLKDKKVKFIWHNITLANSYELTIVSESFNQKYTTSDTTYSVSFPTETKLFNWHVIAKTTVGNSIGSSEQSEVRTNTFDESNSIRGDEFKNITVYPNPTRDELFISGFGDFDFEAKYIEVYDISSKLVLKQTLSSTGSRNSHILKLNTKELNTGTYILKIFTNNPDIVISKIFIKN